MSNIERIMEQLESTHADMGELLRQLKSEMAMGQHDSQETAADVVGAWLNDSPPDVVAENEVCVSPGISAPKIVRKVFDLTDDEIVDAVASFGIDGLFNGDPYPGNAFDSFLEKLNVLPPDADDDETDELGTEVVSRIDKLPLRLHLRADECFAPTNAEWARRLANRSADEIVELLAGTG